MVMLEKAMREKAMREKASKASLAERLSTARFRTWPAHKQQAGMKVLGVLGVVGCIFGCAYSAALLATMVASLCATNFSTDTDESVLEILEVMYANHC